MNDNLTLEEKRDLERIDNLISRKKRTKLKRTPLHKKNRIGLTKIDENYHYRLVNDEGDNLESFLDAGYEFVEDLARGGVKDAADSSQLGKYACQNVGNGVKAYYMRVPNEIYAKDQQEKQAEIDEVEKLIGLDRIPERVRRGNIKIDHSTK